MRDVILYLVLVINILAMVGMVAGILMHSGRGGGLSDMFGGGGGAALGSSSAERNLTRITFAFALTWILSVIALSFLLGADLARRSSRRFGRLRQRFGAPFNHAADPADGGAAETFGGSGWRRDAISSVAHHVGVAEWQTR